MRESAKVAGQSVNEWILGRVEGLNGGIRGADKREGRAKAEEVSRVSEVAAAPIYDVEPENEEVRFEACPECGKELVKNVKMKRWECECGFQMKAAKEKR